MNSKIINEVVVEEIETVDANLKSASTAFLSVGIPTLGIGLVTRDVGCLGMGIVTTSAGTIMQLCRPNKKNILCRSLMRQHIEESEVKEHEDSSERI